jgi:hypothetical protein
MNDAYEAPVHAQHDRRVDGKINEYNPRTNSQTFTLHEAMATSKIWPGQNADHIKQAVR